MAQELKYINGKWVATEIADTESISNEPSAESQRLAEIEEIKKELAKYDYIGNKIATGCATIEEYAPQIAHCQELRKRINELEEGGSDEG